MTDYRDIVDLEEVLGRAHLNTSYLYDDLYKFFKSRIEPKLTEIDREKAAYEAWCDGYDEGMAESVGNYDDIVWSAQKDRAAGKTDTEILEDVLGRLEDGV